MGLDFKSAPGNACIERARALVPTIEAAADEIEQSRELPARIVGLLHEAELFRMLLPRSYDGLEIDFPSYVETIETLARADASVAWCVGQASGCSTAAAYVKPDVARDLFGDPRAVLAWGPPGEGAATVVDGGYRVTGKWQFASGAHHATWIGAHVPIHNPDGTPQLNAAGAPMMRTMLMPREKVTLIDVWRVVGLKGTGSDSYAVTDLFVPHDYTVPRDHGEALERGPLYVFSHMVHFAASFAAVSLGIARAAVDAFIAIADEKTSKTLDIVVRDSEVVQYQLGLAETKLRCARAFLFDSLRANWETVVATGALPSLDRRFSLRMAATYAIGQGREVVETVYNLAGAAAIFESNPFERRLRDVHAVTQQVQGHFSHIENAGKYLLGLPFSRRHI